MDNPSRASFSGGGASAEPLRDSSDVRGVVLFDDDGEPVDAMKKLSLRASPPAMRDMFPERKTGEWWRDVNENEELGLLRAGHRT